MELYYRSGRLIVHIFIIPTEDNKHIKTVRVDELIYICTYQAKIILIIVLITLALMQILLNIKRIL